MWYANVAIFKIEKIACMYVGLKKQCFLSKKTLGTVEI